MTGYYRGTIGTGGRQLCPRCQREFFAPLGKHRGAAAPLPPALSRTDNQTEICSSCGNDEAMLDFYGQQLPEPSSWPVESSLGPKLNQVVSEAAAKLRQRPN